MQINCAAYGCMECCKRYWISVLPSEAKKIAVSLHKDLPTFLQSHCLLQVQLYPTDKRVDNPLVIPSSQIPASFLSKIKEELRYLPPFFLALPTVVFKREKNGSCEFLNQQNGLCTIYENRPEQCRLFPFIPWNNKPLQSLYPFCAFLQDKKPQGRYANNGKAHFKKVEHYFRSVERNGFFLVWKTIPLAGILRLDIKLLGEISTDEFIGLVGLLPQA